MNRLPSAEKGSILVWTAVILAVLIAFAGLATDIPYLYVARQQAQTAADAGAIAGAYGLLNDQTTAEAYAQALSGQTPIIGDLLVPTQIEVFTCDSNGGTVPQCTANSANPDQVTTVTHRDVAHNNPMPLFLLRILQLPIFGLGRANENASGWDAANVSATATARLQNTNSGRCFKPWSIADRWAELSNPTNERFEKPPDFYIPPPHANATGYRSPQDKGLGVTLKVGSPANTISSGFFYAVDFPPINRGTPITGGNTYRDNIATCSPQSFVAVGDQLQVEPGNMVGPTKQGVQDLIALDPNATWDAGCGCVMRDGSPATSSPRLIHMAFFDPSLPIESGRNYVTVANIGGFFIEGVQPNGDVRGVYTDVVSRGGTPTDDDSFLKTVQLVK